MLYVCAFKSFDGSKDTYLRFLGDFCEGVISCCTSDRSNAFTSDLDFILYLCDLYNPVPNGVFVAEVF